jgi:hypothetical protein
MIAQALRYDGALIRKQAQELFNHLGDIKDIISRAQ